MDQTPFLGGAVRRQVDRPAAADDRGAEVEDEAPEGRDEARHACGSAREADEAKETAGLEHPGRIAEEAPDVGFGEEVQDIRADDPVGALVGQRELHRADLELLDPRTVAEGREPLPRQTDHRRADVEADVRCRARLLEDASAEPARAAPEFDDGPGTCEVGVRDEILEGRILVETLSVLTRSEPVVEPFDIGRAQHVQLPNGPHDVRVTACRVQASADAFKRAGGRCSRSA
jgi:hypothetical protein